MPIFYDAPVEPDALTAAIRNVPTPSGNALTAMFPREDKPGNTIDWAEITLKNRTAKYRAWDGRFAKTVRDSATSKTTKLAPLSTSLDMGEYERLQLHFAQTGGTMKEALVQAIYNDATKLTGEVLNRIELAWGDVLLDGALTINENGYEDEADYGLPPEHVATAATLWTDLNAATPLTDLAAWADIWTATNGAPPDSMLTSRRIVRLLQRNKEVIDAVHGATQGRTRVTSADLNALLVSEGLPSIRPTYDTKLNVDDADVRVLPDDRVIMLPADLRDLGYTAWGTSATALELINSRKTEYSFENAAGIYGVVIKDGPPFRQYTYVDATAQPVLEDARKLFVSTVA